MNADNQHDPTRIRLYSTRKRKRRNTAEPKPAQPPIEQFEFPWQLQPRPAGNAQAQ